VCVRVYGHGDDSATDDPKVRRTRAAGEITLSMSATSVVMMEAAMEPSKSTASACKEMCPKLE